MDFVPRFQNKLFEHVKLGSVVLCPFGMNLHPCIRAEASDESAIVVLLPTKSSFKKLAHGCFVVPQSLDDLYVLEVQDAVIKVAPEDSWQMAKMDYCRNVAEKGLLFFGGGGLYLPFQAMNEEHGQIWYCNLDTGKCDTLQPDNEVIPIRNWSVRVPSLGQDYETVCSSSD